MKITHYYLTEHYSSKVVLRNWLSTRLLARDKMAFQRFAQRWREKGKGL